MDLLVAAVVIIDYEKPHFLLLSCQIQMFQKFITTAS